MKRAIHLSIVLLSLVAFRNVFSQDDRWIYLGSNEQNSVYLDKRTVSYGSSNTSFEVWLKVYCLSDCYRSSDGKSIHYVMTRQIYDCTGRESKEIQQTIYYDDGSNYSFSESNWEKVIPDTMGEAILEYVCKHYR